MSTQSRHRRSTRWRFVSICCRGSVRWSTIDRRRRPCLDTPLTVTPPTHKKRYLGRYLLPHGGAIWHDSLIPVDVIPPPLLISLEPDNHLYIQHLWTVTPLNGYPVFVSETSWKYSTGEQRAYSCLKYKDVVHRDTLILQSIISSLLFKTKKLTPRLQVDARMGKSLKINAIGIRNF